MDQTEATRSAILDAALACFADGGMQATTIRAIAKKADVGVGAVTHHFGTKDQIFEACIARWHQSIRNHAPKLLEIAIKADDPMEGVWHAVVEVGYLARQNREAIRVLLHYVVAMGRFPASLLDGMRVGFGDEAAAAISVALKIPPLATRRIVHHGGIIVARLAISGDDELMALYNTDSPERAYELAIRGMADTIVAACFPSDDFRQRFWEPTMS